MVHSISVNIVHGVNVQVVHDVLNQVASSLWCSSKWYSFHGIHVQVHGDVQVVDGIHVQGIYVRYESSDLRCQVTSKTMSNCHQLRYNCSLFTGSGSEMNQVQRMVS